MNRAAPSVLETWQSALEAELQACFAERQGFLYNLLRYHLGWVDREGQPESGIARQSFHSLLSLATGEAVSGDYTPSLPAAAAVELVYNFVLVHNEVQANRGNAGDRPSLWWVWGPAQAINAGDGLHAMGRAAMLRLSDRGLAAEPVLDAIALLDQACLSLCEGQYMDLQFQERLLVTIPEYRDMIGRKTGALTGCAAAAGALAAAADPALARPIPGMGPQLGNGLANHPGYCRLLGRTQRRDDCQQRLEQEKKPAVALYSGKRQHGSQAGVGRHLYETGIGPPGHCPCRRHYGGS